MRTQTTRELNIAVALLVLAVICSSLSYALLQRTADQLDQDMEHVANSRLSH